MSRYIDADKLALHLSDFALQESPNWGANDHGSADAYEAINECIKAIEQQPTADVLENVRGEWLPMKRFGGEKGQTPDVMCSVCHAPALWLGTLGCIRSNYCPNCGADMRGDKHD